MTQYVINIGALPNDGTGDPLRTAFNETNLNFDQVFAAGPVLSNVRIANNTILTTNTNGNLILAPNGIGVVQSNVNIVPNAANIRSLGTGTQRWSSLYVQYANVSGNIDLSGTFTARDLTVLGNLTVTGNTIQIGNLVTDAKTLQLANTAGTANAANGSGITVGVNDNIATVLYNSTSNTWTTNIGISSVGNISAPYFIGNGSQLTGIISSYGNTNVVTLLSAFGSNTISTSGNITGNIVAPGNDGQVLYNRNGQIGASPFDFTFDDTSYTLFVKTGSFGGVAGSGIDALYAGVESFTVLGSDVMVQVTGNVQNYSQVNFQNSNDSRLASGDYIITADNGNDTTHFIDLGMTSSNWDGDQTNSLGNLIGPNNGYLYVQDGNLALGTKTGNTARVWNFDTTGNLTAPGNISGNYFIGNGSQLTGMYGNSNVASYLPTYSGNIGAGNVGVSGAVNAVGEITSFANIVASPGGYFIGDGSQLTGLPAQYGNSNVAAFLAAYGSNTISSTGNITTTANISGNFVAPGANQYVLFNNNGLVSGDIGLRFTSSGNILYVGSTGGKVSVADIEMATGASSLRLISPTSGVRSYGNFVPQFDAYYNLGDSSLRWQNFFANVSNTITSVTTGNVTGGNLITTGTSYITYATGSQGYLQLTDGTNSGYLIGVGTSYNTWAGGKSINLMTTNSGNIGFFPNQSEAGRFTTAGLSVTGEVSATGNVTGGNVLTGGLISSTGNITAGNVNTGIISASGNVTVAGTGGVSQPNLPAFRVYGTSSSDIPANTTITATQGATVDYNQGSSYDNATGIFTAPVAGIYNCTATLRVGTTDTLNQASIQKNSNNSGANVIAFWECQGNSTSNGFGHMSMSGTAKLAVGDTIRLQVILGNVNFDANDSYSVTFLG